MTTALSAAELAQMRTDVAVQLTGTCAILRNSPIPDGKGGDTDVWGTITASTPCRLDVYENPTEDMSLRPATNRVEALDRYILSTEFDEDILAGDRVVVGATTFHVEDLRDEHTWHVLKRAQVTRVD